MKQAVLAVIVAAHVLLAVLFANLTPYRLPGHLKFQGGATARDIGAPDERQHANFVQHLLDGKGLPIFNPDPANPDLYETYESHQPPAYYVMAAAWSKALSIGNVEQSDAIRLRWLNALIGGLATLGVFRLAKHSLRSDVAALLAAAIAALLPMNIALSGAISNDPLLICACAWLLATCAAGIIDGWDVRLALRAGLLLALAALTKTTGLMLIPVALFAVYLSSKMDREEGPHTSYAKVVATAALPVLAFGIPWWLRNLKLYGDPLALKAFSQAFVGTAQASQFIDGLGGWGYWTGINDYGLGVGWWTLRSLFGAFGYMDIFMPSWVYAVFGMVLVAGCVGWIFSLRSMANELKPLHWLNALFLGLVLALFLRINAQYFQAQGRYLLPALGPIAVGLACGISFWAGRRLSVVGGLICGSLLAVDIWLLTWLPGQFSMRVG